MSLKLDQIASNPDLSLPQVKENRAQLEMVLHERKNPNLLRHPQLRNVQELHLVTQENQEFIQIGYVIVQETTRKENHCEDQDQPCKKKSEEKLGNPHKTSSTEENVFRTLKIVGNEKKGATKLSSLDVWGDMARFQCASWVELKKTPNEVGEWGVMVNKSDSNEETMFKGEIIWGSSRFARESRKMKPLRKKIVHWLPLSEFQICSSSFAIHSQCSARWTPLL